MTPKIRVASADEKSLGKCLAHGIWAVRASLPDNWEPGQMLIVKVRDSITAIGLVHGPSIRDDTSSLWPKFPKTIPISWQWVAKAPDQRFFLGEWAKSILREEWGTHYGFRILNQVPLSDRASAKLIKRMLSNCPEEAQKAVKENWPI